MACSACLVYYGFVSETNFFFEKSNLFSINNINGIKFEQYVLVKCCNKASIRLRYYILKLMKHKRMCYKKFVSHYNLLSNIVWLMNSRTVQGIVKPPSRWLNLNSFLDSFNKSWDSGMTREPQIFFIASPQYKLASSALE